MQALENVLTGGLPVLDSKSEIHVVLPVAPCNIYGPQLDQVTVAFGRKKI